MTNNQDRLSKPINVSSNLISLDALPLAALEAILAARQCGAISDQAISMAISMHEQDIYLNLEYLPLEIQEMIRAIRNEIFECPFREHIDFLEEIDTAKAERFFLGVKYIDRHIRIHKTSFPVALTSEVTLNGVNWHVYSNANRLGAIELSERDDGYDIIPEVDNDEETYFNGILAARVHALIILAKLFMWRVVLEMCSFPEEERGLAIRMILEFQRELESELEITLKFLSEHKGSCRRETEPPTEVAAPKQVEPGTEEQALKKRLMELYPRKCMTALEIIQLDKSKPELSRQEQANRLNLGIEAHEAWITRLSKVELIRKRRRT